MKPVFIFILLFTLVGSVYSQGITLLYKGGGYSDWNDAASWIQINTPNGQLPIQRIPTELDDVVFSKALSGIASANFSADPGTQNFTIGGSGTTGKRCRSMHISNTEIYFAQTENLDYYGATLQVYTSNGGFVLIDSGANLARGIFELNGGNTAIIDLEIINSSYGTLFSHGSWSNIELKSTARARFTNSTLQASAIVADGGELYTDNCGFRTVNFQMLGSSTATILNSSIESLDHLNFLIGRDVHFVSENFNISTNFGLTLCTSGSVLNGNVRTFYWGDVKFVQEDPAKPLPNIVNGNVTFGETNGLDIAGGLKISGDLFFYIDPRGMIDTTHAYVNGQRIFKMGGLYASCPQGFCNSKIEFFGNTNSNVNWPIGFPVDTLIINKSGCAKVTFTNSLYVSAVAKIQQGQLVLDPNDTIPYKLVCAGDLNISQGGGVFLRKNAAGIVANMAIDGNVYDYNTIADSNCVGLSNPYNGDITLYKTSQGSNNTLAIMSNSNIGNVNLIGEPGADFVLGGNLMVNNFSFVNTGKLLLGAYNLTVNGSILNYGPSNYFVTNGLGKLQINNIGNVATTFPVGISSSSYTPATLTNVGTIDNFSVNVQPQVLSGGNAGRAYTSAVVNRTWSIDESIPGGSNVSLTLQWNAADELAGFTRNAAWLSHYTSGAWNTGTQMPATGAGPYSITRNNITNFSPFAVMGSSVALPVTLLDFYGRNSDKGITLSWSTETELNTKYFTVEKSFDQVLFNPVVNVSAAGNSSGKKNYQYVDNGFLKAINYYRLKNVDLDGVYTYSKTIAVTAPMDNSILIFPNPVKDELFIRLQDALAETKISIIDSKGISVKELKLKAGTTNISINISDLSPGIYSIVFYAGKAKNTQQFIKQ